MPLFAVHLPVSAQFLLSVLGKRPDHSAAAFPLFGNQMYNRLGYQWASSLLAFLTLAMLPFPYLFFKYGKTIRSRSSYAKS